MRRGATCLNPKVEIRGGSKVGNGRMAWEAFSEEELREIHREPYFCLNEFLSLSPVSRSR